MFGTASASANVSRQVDELLRHLEGVKEGAAEAVHQSRVTIRRLREQLALAAAHLDEDELQIILRRLKRGARALSRLRDADVGRRLLENVTARALADPMIASRLREMLLQEREAAWRQAIKALEKLKLEELPGDVGSVPRRRRRRLGRVKSSFRDHLASRAGDVRSAMAKAGAIYFPNRLHSARIAIKRLRYAIELGDRMGAERPAGALGTLKKAQDLLGEAHDRELLLARFEQLRAEAKNGEDIVRLETAVRSDIRDSHHRYLALRPEIEAITEMCSITTSGHRVRNALVAAGIAVPSLMLLGAGLKHQGVADGRRGAAATRPVLASRA